MFSNIEGIPPVTRWCSRMRSAIRLSRPLMGLMEGELSRRERCPWREELREVLREGLLLPLLSLLLHLSKWAPRLPPSTNEKPPMMASAAGGGGLERRLEKF